MRRALIPSTMVAALMTASMPVALSQTTTMGNDVVLRDQVDGRADFTIVDTNNPAPLDGELSSITFYAHRAGVVQFVLVNAEGTVTWVSDEIVASATGPMTVAQTEIVSVAVGDNLGVYSKNAGVVTWSSSTASAPASYTAANDGTPTIGDALAFDGTANRTYSMQAKITGATEPAPMKDDCRDGGWQEMGYRNQGHCVSSMQANEHSKKG